MVLSKLVRQMRSSRRAFHQILRPSRGPGEGGALKQLFQQHPLLANCVACGALYTGAEFCQQTLHHFFVRWQGNQSDTENQSPVPQYDTASLMRFGFLGTCVYPVMCTIWYKWLDARYTGKTKTILAKKLFLDQFVFGPPCLLIFFLGLSYLEGKENWTQECREKFPMTYVADCAFWLPLQAVNFTFVPAPFRVLYLGISSFVWVNVLCVIKNIENYKRNNSKKANNEMAKEKDI